MNFSPTSPSLWLALSVFAGIFYMAIGGAPPHYLAINAIALALVMIRYMPIPKSGRAHIGYVAAAICALCLPILMGANLDGIRRWIGFGPVQLHSGMLVLPMLIMILPRLKMAQQLAATALAAIAISIQPDRASAIALLAGAGAMMFTNRSVTNIIQLVFACFAVGATFIQPDALQPVVFVENVLSDAWQQNPLIAAILGLSLAATLILPVFNNRKLAAVMASLGGFALASLLGPYPVPLVGYGAASILGFGLAVALARADAQNDPQVMTK